MENRNKCMAQQWAFGSGKGCTRPIIFGPVPGLSLRWLTLSFDKSQSEASAQPLMQSHSTKLNSICSAKYGVRPHEMHIMFAADLIP